MRIIDKENWARKEHFEFFSAFDEPFFGLVAQVDVSKAYQYSKTENKSFFAVYLHAALVAANRIEAFRMRLVEDQIVLFDAIHASPTLGRKDHTFGFSFIPFEVDFEIFQKQLYEANQTVQQTTGLCLSDNAYRKDVIHFSSIPWANFTGITHARDFKINDSSPKISFGKVFDEGHLKKMSVAVFVHHAFADAFNVGVFLEEFQALLNKF